MQARARRGGGAYPTEIERDIDALLYVKHIADLGQKEGIASYLGKTGQGIYREIVKDDVKRDVERDRIRMMAQKSAENRGLAGIETRKAILAAAKKLETSGTAPRTINKTIASDMNLTPQYVAKVRRGEETL
jgi:hypothetical protein